MFVLFLFFLLFLFVFSFFAILMFSFTKVIITIADSNFTYL